MNVIKFSIFSFAGALIWSAALTYLGVLFGENWSILEVYFRKFSYLIIGGFILVGAGYVYYKIQKIKKASS
jgi:membrane protein DedA with SNARE-associated domain